MIKGVLRTFVRREGETSHRSSMEHHDPMNTQHFCLSCFVFVLAVCSTSAQPVQFADPALEEVIRKAIEKPSGEIEKADLAKLEKLTIYNTQTKDLGGLEQCVNITNLNCQGNPLQNIDALAQMPQLKHLVIEISQIDDISALRSLQNLDHLSLNGTRIKSLDPLAGLTSLTYLNIGRLLAGDIKALSGLENIETLRIEQMSLTDLEFVRGMPRLRYLTADGNNIQSVEPLQGLHGLISISLESNRITEIASLSKLPQLRFLNLNENAITSVAGMPPIMSEGIVRLHGNQISDLSPLVPACADSNEICVELGDNPLSTESICRDLPEILSRGHRLVYKYSTREEEIEPFPALSTLCGSTKSIAEVNDVLSGKALGGATLFADDHLELAVRKNLGKPSGIVTPEELLAMVKLDAGFDRISNLSGIEQLENLTTLNLSGNFIQDLAPIAKLAKLESLFLFQNRVKSLEPLQGLQRLEYLVIGHNPLSHVWPLVNLPSLRRLDTSGNRIKDPEKLGRLTGLYELNVDDAELANLDFVVTLKEMGKLSAQHNELTTLEPLRGIRHLVELDITGNRIETITPLSAMNKLYRLDLSENQLTSLDGFPRLQRDATILLFRNRLTDIQPLVGVFDSANQSYIELGHNKLTETAFCRDIPAMEEHGTRVLYRYDFPLEKATPFGKFSNLCDIVDGPFGEPLLRAMNAGTSSEELLARFGSSADSTDTLFAAAATPPAATRHSQGPTADIAVQLADTHFNVSMESSGFDLQSLLGGIAFVGVVVILVIVVKMPRAKR